MSAIFFGFSAYTFVAYSRTRSNGLLIVALYQAFAAATAASYPGVLGTRPPQPNAVPAIFVALTLFFGVWMGVLAFGKRLKWRGRDLLELAAQPVDEAAAIGYTDRPRPVGRVDTTERELAAFADFCRRNLIAVPYVEPNRVVLALVIEGQDYGVVLGLHRDYADDTWVAFDREGNVTAHIARRDYLRYRDDLSFDQLCVSLGQVFVDFLGLFAQGNNVRIIDRLNAMPVGIMS
jgi:hypothetical protein